MINIKNEALCSNIIIVNYPKNKKINKIYNELNKNTQDLAPNHNAHISQAIHVDDHNQNKCKNITVNIQNR